MQIKKLSLMLLFALSMAAFLNGCGASSKEAGVLPSDVPKVSESVCAQCHSASLDAVAGTKIYEAYLGSTHYTNNFSLVGCQDCHGGGSQHNGVGPIPYADPSASGICFNCHKNYLPPNHFRNMTASSNSVSSAMFVTANYAKSCTSCHDPHLGNNGIRNGELSTVTTSTAAGSLIAGQAKPTEHSDWAASDHGDINGQAWATEDFKNVSSGGSYACIRCHTSTGYINYVTSNYANAFPTTTWAVSGDKGREVLTCKACHTDYNYKNRIRRASAYTAPYNKGKSPQAFLDFGNSNLCIACHSGRESGDSVLAVSNFTNASFVNSHYLAAAGTFYGVEGFKYYSSNRKYDTGFNTGATVGNWSHGTLGVLQANGSDLVSGGIDTGTNGACIVCHLGNTDPNPAAAHNPNSHTLSARAVAAVTQTFQSKTTGCYGCHGTDTIPTLIDAEKDLFDRAMDFFLYNLNQNGIFYSTTYPYFYTSAAATTAIKNWTRSATIPIGPVGGSGAQNMGATFNYNLLLRETGSHVHNRTYIRRLMFDSIQYLQKGAVSYSTSTGAIGGATDPNTLISFSAYSTLKPTYTGANGNSESITALKGYLLRSSGGQYYRR